MQLEEIFDMGSKVSAVLAPANLHCKMFAVSRTEAIRQIALDKINHHNWEFDPDNAFAIMYWADPNQGLIINVNISIEIKGK